MAGDDQWVRVAGTDEMREGAGYDTGREVAGEVVGLFLIDGVYYATGECSHEKGPICQGHRDGLAVSCPWHSAQFNVATGECLQGPVACRTDGSVATGEMQEADKVGPLTCFEVKVVGKDIFVRPREAKSQGPGTAGTGGARR